MRSQSAASRMIDASDRPVLGIIAGSDRLPAKLIEACQGSGRRFFVLGFEGSTDPSLLAHVPHAVVRLGAIGEALEHLRRAGVKEVVMGGKVNRPSFASLRPDLEATKLLARIGTAFFAGDDMLFKAIVSFLEAEGFHVIGSQDVLSELITPEGNIGKLGPDARAKADISQGFLIGKKLGELDIGQAIVVENGYVLGVEAAEGTDGLITRCAGLTHDIHRAVLIKVKKPQQEGRVDLPAIGVVTVEKAYAAGFAGIAIEAGGSIILDIDQVAAKADELGIFVVGVSHE